MLWVPHHPSPVDNVRLGLRSPSILPTSYPTKHEIHLMQAQKQRREQGEGAMKLENERCGTFVHFLLNPSHVLGTKHRQSERSNLCVMTQAEKQEIAATCPLDSDTLSSFWRTWNHLKMGIRSCNVIAIGKHVRPPRYSSSRCSPDFSASCYQ